MRKQARRIEPGFGTDCDPDLRVLKEFSEANIEFRFARSAGKSSRRDPISGHGLGDFDVKLWDRHGGLASRPELSLTQDFGWRSQEAQFRGSRPVQAGYAPLSVRTMVKCLSGCDDHAEHFVGVRNHRDFGVIGLVPRERLQISDHHSFLSRCGGMAESSDLGEIILEESARSLQEF